MAIDNITGAANSGVQGASDNSKSQLARSTPTAAKQETGKPATTDTVVLTEMAAQLKKLEADLSSVPVVDIDRVEGVKQALINGSFKIDSQEVAKKFISFESALSG